MDTQKVTYLLGLWKKAPHKTVSERVKSFFFSFSHFSFSLLMQPKTSAPVQSYFAWFQSLSFSLYFVIPILSSILSVCTFQTDTMIGKSRSESRSAWQNTSYRGFYHGGCWYKPHHTSRPTIPIVAPPPWAPPMIFCELCEVKISSYANMEQHNKGKRHQRKLLELDEESQRQKTRNGLFCEICDMKISTYANLENHKKGKRHQSMLLKLHEKSERQKTRNGQKSGQKQKAVQKFEKNGSMVENVSSTATIGKNKDYQHKNIKKAFEVVAKEPKKDHRDNVTTKGHGLKCKISGASGGKYMKTNDGLRRPVELSKHDVDAQSNSAASKVQVPEVKPAAAAGDFQIMAPTPSEAQSQHVSALHVQVSEGKEHHETQNPMMQTNDQAQSISVELLAPAGSSVINIQTEDVSSDRVSMALARHQEPVASKALEPPLEVESSVEPQIQHVLLTESKPQVSEAIAHQECNINPFDKTSTQLPSSMVVEFDAPTGSSSDTKITYGSSKIEEKMDAAATELGMTQLSQVFASPISVASSFEPQIQHILQTEPSEVAQNESQNPTEKTDTQLPSSMLVEFDAPASSSTNIQTSNGTSKAEEKKDVPTNITQVAICLQCGNKGFPETLVFCKCCQIYGLHRYCLDGPVIFHDDVTWFCEDCEENEVDICSHDQSTLLPSRTSDTVNLEKDANQAIELTTCIKSVNENEQQQQNTAAETKVLSSDSHSSSNHQPQCNDNCQEHMFKKECQPAPKDVAISSEGLVCVQNSQVATNDHVNFVELDGHFAAQPVADPIWRGTFCLHIHSAGSVTIAIGLLAHLSSLACSKVQEETKLFPTRLSVDLLQRSAVWPKVFMNRGGPTADSIALYFFPENERAEKDYDKLVDDIINQDFALSTVLENAELLVFPSTVLQFQHRRFQAKYYLWGVFRAKQTLPGTNDARCGEDIGVDPLT